MWVQSRRARTTVRDADATESDTDSADDDMASSTRAGSSSSSTGSLVRQPGTVATSVGREFAARCKYIPMRCTLEERKFLRLLDAALTVSEYTDKIDIVSCVSRGKRIVAQIREFCSILSGLVLAADYRVGQALFRDKNFGENEAFFQMVFELRRYKTMNPDKMRSTYGKLVYMLQDAQLPEIRDTLGFTSVREIRTVHNSLDERAAAMLEDAVVELATREIIPDGKQRRAVQQEIKQKERAIEALSRKYASNTSPPEVLKQCLYSIGDNHAFLRQNRDPVIKMICRCKALPSKISVAYLKMYFSSSNIEKGYSLAIKSGRDGARLTHNHEKQYNYVLQSLTLWREILHEFFMLWMLVEQDLLDPESIYRLRDTGQGFNRVQACPRTSRIMHGILHRAQQSIGYWVGSSVIHLGYVTTDVYPRSAFR